jgi:hypothetical protein
VDGRPTYQRMGFLPLLRFTLWLTPRAGLAKSPIWWMLARTCPGLGNERMWWRPSPMSAVVGGGEEEPMRVRKLARGVVVATTLAVLAAMLPGTSLAAPKGGSQRYLVVARTAADY